MTTFCFASKSLIFLRGREKGNKYIESVEERKKDRGDREMVGKIVGGGGGGRAKPTAERDSEKVI